MWVKCSHCKRGGNGNNQCIHGKDIKRCKNDVGCVTTGELLDKYKNGKQNYQKNHAMVKECKDCLSCSDSFSEEGKDGNYDKLFCVFHQKYVEEEGTCKNWN